MEPEIEEEQKKQAERVHFIACCFGYNELAKLTDVLGEKVYYRLMRERMQKTLTSLGGDMLFAQDDGVCTIEVPGEPLRVKFLESDIEMTRKAVADYEEKHRPPPPVLLTADKAEAAGKIEGVILRHSSWPELCWIYCKDGVWRDKEDVVTSSPTEYHQIMGHLRDNAWVVSKP